MFEVAVLPASAATGGACAAFAVRAPAGATIPPHIRREQDAAVLVLAGAVEVVCGAERLRLERGGTAPLPRGVACRIDVLTDAHVVCFALPAALEDLAAELATGTLVRDDALALLSTVGISLLPDGWSGRPR